MPLCKNLAHELCIFAIENKTKKKGNIMTTLAKTMSKDIFDSILPVYGQPREKMPVWDEGQKMFIVGEYESAAGNRTYSGLRFCDRIVICEEVGLFHNWTYINGIELYAFNGKNLELIQKKEYAKVYRKDEFVRRESEAMVADYLKGVLKMRRVALPCEEVESQARQYVEGCYQSFLSPDYNVRLTQILPKLLN